MAHFHVVTGASSGIGKAVVDRLTEQGEQVIAVGRTVGVWKNPSLIKYVYCDFDNYAHPYATARTIIKTMKPFIRSFFWCAGINNRDVDQNNYREYDKHLKINFLTQLNFFEELIPCFNTQFTLVGLGSFLEKGSKKYPAYGASKSALGHYVRTFNHAYGHHNNWRACLVYPGRVNTLGNPKRDLTPEEAKVPFREPEEVARKLVTVLDCHLTPTFLDFGIQT